MVHVSHWLVRTAGMARWENSVGKARAWVVSSYSALLEWFGLKVVLPPRQKRLLPPSPWRVAKVKLGPRVSAGLQRSNPGSNLR